MPLETKEITGLQIWEGIEKNGLKQIREMFIVTDEKGNITAGCLLTQAAVNVDAVPSNGDGEVLDQLFGQDTPQESFYEEPIISLYDALSDIKTLSPRWKYHPKHPDDNDFVMSVGEAIVAWYDLKDNHGNYALPTWEECLIMAKEILEPYFDHLFTVTTLSSVLAFPRE